MGPHGRARIPECDAGERNEWEWHAQFDTQRRGSTFNCQCNKVLCPIVVRGYWAQGTGCILHPFLVTTKALTTRVDESEVAVGTGGTRDLNARWPSGFPKLEFKERGVHTSVWCILGCLWRSPCGAICLAFSTRSMGTTPGICSRVAQAKGQIENRVCE